MQSLFNLVNFGPDDVRATMEPERFASKPRCVVMSVLTSQTCGEACWHAREEICRCSCGGKNHGCLLVPGGDRPERMAKIDGHPYRLLAVGIHRELMTQAAEINRRQFRSVETPRMIFDSQDAGPIDFAAADAARAAGQNVWFGQYRYAWKETDSGAPARLKFASKDQMARWTELAGWQHRAREGVALLWEIQTMPPAPREPVIDRNTGRPITNPTESTP